MPIKSGLMPLSRNVRSWSARYRARSFLRTGSKSKSKPSMVLSSGNFASLIRRSTALLMRLARSSSQSRWRISRSVKLSSLACSSSDGASRAIPGRRSQRSFWTNRSRESSSRFIGILVDQGRRTGIAGHRRRDELVVEREVGFAERERVEHRIAEPQWCRRRCEPLLVAKYVLDVLGADVAGEHHLGHRVARGLLAEQLDEEDQPHGLAVHGAPTGRDDLEVL